MVDQFTQVTLSFAGVVTGATPSSHCTEWLPSPRSGSPIDMKMIFFVIAILVINLGCRDPGPSNHPQDNILGVHEPLSAKIAGLKCEVLRHAYYQNQIGDSVEIMVEMPYEKVISDLNAELSTSFVRSSADLEGGENAKLFSNGQITIAVFGKHKYERVTFLNIGLDH
jgi:hypothetical protein